MDNFKNQKISPNGFLFLFSFFLSFFFSNQIFIEDKIDFEEKLLQIFLKSCHFIADAGIFLCFFKLTKQFN